MSASRSDAERDIKACGQRDDAQPFPWSQARAKVVRPARAYGEGDTAQDWDDARKADAPPFDPADMQAVAVALFGECRVCKALLEVDGSCPAASEHPKHECRGCGALHDAPVTVAHPCLFCSNSEAAQ